MLTRVIVIDNAQLLPETLLLKLQKLLRKSQL